MGFYKKPHRPTTPALHISLKFTFKTMPNDCEVQELLRESRERGLQKLMRNPPESAPREETPPVLHPPMQTCSTRKKFKVEFCSKRNEERHKPSGKTLEDPEMYPRGSAKSRHAICIMQKYIGMLSWGYRLLRTQSCGWSNVR